MKKIVSLFMIFTLLFLLHTTIFAASYSEEVPQALETGWDNVFSRGDYFQVVKNGKNGLADKNGSIILKPELKQIFFLSDADIIGIKPAANKNNEYMDIHGNVLFTLPSKDILYGFYHGLSVVATEGTVLPGGKTGSPPTYGVIDTKGKFVIPLSEKYDSLFLSSDSWNTEVILASKKIGSKIYFGFIDRNEKTMIPFLYDSIQAYRTEGYFGIESAKYFCGGIAIACRNGKYGAIDQKGKTVIPFNNDEIRLHGSFAIIKKDGKYGVVKNDGSSILPVSHNTIEVSSEKIRVDEKYGVIPLDGSFPSALEWDSIGLFRDNLALVSRNGKYGFVDRNGKIVCTAKWDFAYEFANGLAIVKSNGLYGFINTTGATVSEPQWNWMDAFKNGIARVAKGKMSGFIDTTGKIILSTDTIRDELERFSIVSGTEMKFNDDFSENGATLVAGGAVYRVSPDGKMTLVSAPSAPGKIDERTGEGITWKWSAKTDWGSMSFFEGSNGLIRVFKDNMYGMIDIHGKVITQPKWEFMRYYFSEGMVAIGDGDKNGFMDEKGNVIGMDRWQVEDFKNGLARVCKDYTQYGYIDKQGKIVGQLQWDWAQDFSEGMAVVQKNKKFGFMDNKGKLAIPLQWDWAGDFHEGLAMVSKGGKFGFIDKLGKVVSQPQWLKAHNFSNGLAAVCTNPNKKGYDEKWGYINKNGKLVIPAKWDWVNDFTCSITNVEVDNQYGIASGAYIINQVGKVVFSRKDGCVYGISEDIAQISDPSASKFSYINKEGKVFYSAAYTEPYNGSAFQEGMALIFKNNQAGYVNSSGREVVAPQFDGSECYRFYNGRARVVKDKIYRYIDKSGNYINPFEFAYGSYFQDGYTVVSVGCLFDLIWGTYIEENPDGGPTKIPVYGKYTLMDSGGKLLSPMIWDGMSLVSNGYAIAKVGEMFGIIQIIPGGTANTMYTTERGEMEMN